MKTLGNILWFILGFGWLAGTMWILAGALCCMTVIGIPFGMACFRIAPFAYAPFGKELVDARDLGEQRIALTGLANFLWVVLIGLWTSISFICAGIAACCMIVTIPFGFAYFKLAVAAFAPLGKRIVSSEMARVIRERKASGELDQRLNKDGTELEVRATGPENASKVAQKLEELGSRFIGKINNFSTGLPQRQAVPSALASQIPSRTGTTTAARDGGSVKTFERNTVEQIMNLAPLRTDTSANTGPSRTGCSETVPTMATTTWNEARTNEASNRYGTTKGSTMSTSGISFINEKVQQESAFVAPLRAELEKVVVGQRYMLDRLLVGLLANGHILLEGVPGLAKTLAVKTLAAALETSFRRIQFTPDLLPADLIGTQIYNPKTGDFGTRKGPVFANIVLADEINRAPAKVQSALLEAMEERQVTIGQETFALPEPFLVLATQNPVEQEGTYPLPEAQVDRFMLKLKIGYPTLDEERRILEANARTEVVRDVRPVVKPDTILKARKTVDAIYVDDKIKDYVLSLVFATRDPAAYKLNALAGNIRYGASPRATLALMLAAKAHAFLQGRGYVTPQDVKSVAPDVLRHRIIPSFEAEAEELTADSLVSTLLDELPVP